MLQLEGGNLSLKCGGWGGVLHVISQ